jgi:uncharacterized membrane protein YtjA (UPF0391 family)
MSKGAMLLVAIALITAILGFGGVIGSGVGWARVAFFIFALFAFIALVMGRDVHA